MNFWTPYHDTSDFLERGKFILAWRLTILFYFVFFTLSIVFSVGLHEEFYTYVACAFVSTSSLLYLHYTKRCIPIYWFLSIIGTLIVAYTVNFLPYLVHYGDFFWMILIIAFSFFCLGIRVGVVFLLVNLASIIYYVISSLDTNIISLQPLNLETKFALIVELSIAVFCISYVIYQFVSIHKQAYSELLIANNKLHERNSTIEIQNEEKTTLVKEIHHRVKNNLQIIVSLLRLQKSEIRSEEAKTQFSQAINRILVMSLIHRKLYQEEKLAEDIKSLSETDFRTKITVHSEIEKVGLKTIVPLGLLINELVSNSIKHAFNDTTNGEIQIQILAEQMDGEVKKESSEEGTPYTFSLKNIDIEK